MSAKRRFDGSCLPCGAQIGRYRILEPLASGGMGEVYRAHDLRLDREVALKALPRHLRDVAAARRRFEWEARITACLSHPHVCSLHDAGEEAGLLYFVMELLQGETLRERLKRGPLDLPQTLSVGAQIARALGAVHERGIVHRDVKPSNVFLHRDGVKLFDFGIATSTECECLATSSLASTGSNEDTAVRPPSEMGELIGTLQYMAPEQLLGLAVDEGTDLYALGAVLYEMATGQRAFCTRLRDGREKALASRRVSRLESLHPVPLDRAVARCLAWSRCDRWPSAHRLAAALEQLAAEMEEAEPLYAAG